MARGIVETLSIKPFCVMVVNTSKLLVTLPKSMKDGQLTEAPLMINPLRDILSAKPVNAIQFYKRKQNEDH